ncbi:DNA polymerase Y family protein [Tersicoccus sp. MR15.9]|uniref:DNA polymerase Y family protein n=1 Tax=Tersicoccus mangrovi TaxID=3121635 RepID=UPI002FE55A22
MSPSSGRAATRGTGGSTGTDRVVVVLSPRWPVISARTTGRLPSAGPAAVVDRGRVAVASVEAEHDGVQPGQRLRDAQSRCPELAVTGWDPAADEQAFEPVVKALEEISPAVQIIEPGRCALRARGVRRYHGTEEEAARALLHVLDGQHVPGRIGIADTLFAAQQAADRATDEVPLVVVPAGRSAAFLAPLPVAVLPDPVLVSLLHRLGRHTLGEFAAMDAGAVRARFGAAGVDLHRWAAGTDPRSVVARTPPQDFDRVAEFEPPLTRADQVAFAFRVAAEDVVSTLADAGLACTRIHLTLTGEDGIASERSWTHPRHFTAAEITDRIRWQLEGEVSSGPAPGAGRLEQPVARVRLTPERTEPIGQSGDGLWGAGVDEHVDHGLTRIQSMLGHRGVLTAVTGGGRLLGERRVLVPWGDAVPAPVRAEAARPWPGALPGPPPATVFDRLHPVLLLDGTGAPVVLAGRGELSAPPDRLDPEGTGTTRAVLSWAGPWPVRQRWWDAERNRRVDRVQVIDETSAAWLLVTTGSLWWAEARYD